jgi:hypothetical protein
MHAAESQRPLLKSVLDGIGQSQPFIPLVARTHHNGLPFYIRPIFSERTRLPDPTVTTVDLVFAAVNYLLIPLVQCRAYGSHRELQMSTQHLSYEWSRTKVIFLHQFRAKPFQR